MFRRWFPFSLSEQAMFFKVFTEAFKKIADSLGFDNATIEALEKDCAMMQYLAAQESAIETIKKAASEFRKKMTKGKNNVEAHYLDYILPERPPIVPYGIFDRLFHLADRIEAAKGYTTVTGAELGILPRKPEALRAEDLKLKLKSVKSMSEAHAEIRFVRGRTSGVNLYMQRAGSDEWIDLGRFFHSPIVIKILLLNPTKPEQIYLRGRYLIGNEAVGDYSAITPLIVTP